MGGPADPKTTGQILQFRVVAGNDAADHSCDPGAGECVLRPNNPIVRLNPDPAQVPTRRLTLNEEQGANGPLTLFMNNTELGDLGVQGTLTTVVEILFFGFVKNQDQTVWEILRTGLVKTPGLA